MERPWKHGTLSFPWKGNYEADALKILEYFKESERIIDLGFGAGDLMKRLAEKYPDKEIVGLETCSAKSDTGLPWLQGDITEMPIRSGSFDGALCTFVLDYVDRNKAMMEIRRIVKPYGRIVAYCHHPENGVYEWLKEEAEKSSDKTKRPIYEAFSRNRFKSHEEFERFIEDNSSTGTIHTNVEVGNERGLTLMTFLENDMWPIYIDLGGSASQQIIVTPFSSWGRCQYSDDREGLSITSDSLKVVKSRRSMDGHDG